jgi:hypothetical protein
MVLMLKDRDFGGHSFSSFKDFVNSPLCKTIFKSNTEVAYSFCRKGCSDIIRMLF